MGDVNLDGIELAPYDQGWPEAALEETTLLKKTLGDLRIEIEHIGSTSVPSLDAKPIIDLMIGVESLDCARETIAPLEQIGYSYWRENPHKEHFFFVKGLPMAGGTDRTHHVHVVTKNSDFWRMQILFRDYLRSHPLDAADYLNLKSDLALKFRDDREGYTNGKTNFVNAILAKAGFCKTQNEV